MVLPLEASTGEAPQSAARAASLRRRVGLSPATSSRRAAICGPMPVWVRQPRRGFGGQVGQERVELGDLVGQRVVASCECPQGVTCRVQGVELTCAMHPCAALEQRLGIEVAQRLAQVVGGGQDKVLELQDRLAASFDGARAGVAQHADRFDDPVT